MTSDVRSFTSSNKTPNPILNHRTSITSELETISRLDTSGSFFGSSTEDELHTYHEVLENWLLNATIYTFSKFSLNKKSLGLFTRIIGLPTSLACAFSYYIPESLKTLSTDGKLDQVCLDNYISVFSVLETSALDVDSLCYKFQHDLFKDDSENVKRILNLIQRFYEANKSLFNSDSSLFTSITHLLNQYNKRPPNERVGFKQPEDLCLVINIYQLICNLASDIPATCSSICHPSSTIVSSCIGAPVATTTFTTITNPIQSDIVQSNYNSRVQNGVLHNLVRTSGVVAKPARPAHPSNQPIPVVNQCTVDQLVSSSINSVNHSEMNGCRTTAITSSSSSIKLDEDIHSTDLDKLTPVDNALIINSNNDTSSVSNVITSDETNDLLTDIARVAFNRGCSTRNVDADSEDTKQLQQQISNSSNVGHYYLNKCTKPIVENTADIMLVNSSTTEISTTSDTIIDTAANDDTQPFTRNSLYSTFNKRPTPCLSSKLPSIGSLSQPNNPLKRLGNKTPRVNSVTNINLSQVTLPSLRSEFENRKRSMSTVSHADVAQISKIDTNPPLGTTTWKDSGAARFHAHRVADANNTTGNGIPSSSTKYSQETSIPGRTAALRLSLDQRRRAIEMSRQRQRIANTKATAERNNAAFVKLLQKQFLQRQSVPGEESKLPNGTLSETETSSLSLPIKSDQLQKCDRSCVNSECAHFTTDKDEITVSGSNIDHGTDLDEDFSMNSSSTMPNISEPLQDSTVVLETDDTAKVIEDNFKILTNEPNTLIPPCPESPQLRYNKHQTSDLSSLTVEPSLHHGIARVNNHYDQPNQESGQHADVIHQRSDSSESNYAPSNFSVPQATSLGSSNWYQSLPYQRKQHSKRPKFRLNERESTPQPESYADMNYHHATQHSHTHKGLKRRNYADKTYPGSLASPTVADHEHGPFLVDSFHGPQPPFKHRHTSRKNYPYDISPHSLVDERLFPHKYVFHRHRRPHDIPNQIMQSGSYHECSSNEASSETDDDDNDYSNDTYDDHPYSYVNRMSYSGRFSHQSLSRHSKSHSKNRYRSNGRKSAEYGYELDESDSRPHSPVASHASFRGVVHNMNSSLDSSNHSVIANSGVAHIQTITDEPVVKADVHNMSVANQPCYSGKREEFPVSVNATDLSNSSTAPSNPSPVENSQQQVKSPVVSTHNANSEGKLFFIGFEEPDPERMQRTKDRLEARRATEKAMVAEQLEVLRTTGRKEKEAADRVHFERKLNEKERREAVLQAHLSKKEASVSPTCRNNNNPYPVRSGSSSLSKSEVNLSSAVLKHSSNKRTVTTPKRDRNALVAASLDTFPSSKPSSRLNSAKSKPPPVTTRGSGDGEAVEASAELDYDSSSLREAKVRTARATRHINGNTAPVNNAGSRNLLPSGITLHRLGASESPSSGPGVPVQCLNQPRLFVKPKAKSNRTVVVNAISHCCLAGTVNEPTKQLALKELAATEGTHFMILFRDSRCQYRAVYSFDLELEELKIICGNGPRRITHDMVNRFFKYNSGTKQFTQITSTKHLSPVVDAVTIHDALWTNKSSGGAHTILSTHCT
ncbi:Calmodulin-regulated spectrin-associated protein 1-B [Schistosoma japonicum]|nr:Calmodulin-regulated spectrin-associated protein 1-B [Schistosoma japonicum]